MSNTPEEKKRAVQAKLQKAVELEWSTIPPYLIAYYSLRPEKNREVASLIKSVFMEEMLHMVLAANVLTAIGGGARLDGENCPSYPLRLEFQGKQFADRQFDIHLAAFSPETIETFLQIELPENLHPTPTMLVEHLVIEGSTIGEFYRGLKRDLEELTTEAGAAFVFTGKLEHQIPAHSYWSAGGGIVQVTDFKTAFQALDIIVDQGEGASGTINALGPGYFRNPTDVAHFFRFNEIKHQRHYRATDHPADPPSGEPFAVDYHAIHPIKTDCQPADFEGDAKLGELNNRFNRTYSLMLRELQDAFNGNPEVLFSATMDGMHGLRDIAVAMMQIPLPRDPFHHAAPTFQWALPPGAESTADPESGPSAFASPFTKPTNAVTLSLPLKVTVSLDEGSVPASASIAAASTTGFAAAAAPETMGEISAGFAALRANAERPYYDAAQDEADRASYYAGIDWQAGGQELYRQLSAKVRDTHSEQVGYRPSVELYPWVDLQPDRSIRSIYSGQSSTPDAFIAHDDQVDARRQASLNQHLAAYGAGFAPLAALLESLEATMPYNCEHTVPQSWFSKKAPMRGDLHHLFACETRCNSARGNQPYYDSPATPGSGNDCGTSGPDGFEPKGGKGAVARSTLYFLLRYPSAIGDAARELQADRLAMLLQWHQENPVTEYELHRNQAIFQRQGNRNPLIDFPEMADHIDFLQGFGRPAQPHHFAARAAAFHAAASAQPPALFPYGQPRPQSSSAIADQLAAGFAGNDFAVRTLATSTAAALDDAAALRARSRFKPLPAAPGNPPYRLDLESLLGAAAVASIEQAGQFIFHSVGDTGQHGHGAEAQESVAFHLEQQVTSAVGADRPALFYHLGDIIYYSGELNFYPEQFYDPYQYYPGPIVAIPGNHDGDNVRGDHSLSAFVQNFCTATPSQPPMPGDSTRLTMIQPNVYFTLLAPFVTIIGLYSNVTGDLDDPNFSARPQYKWLVGELREADANKFLIIAVHHPIYSADNDHGGEKKIGKVLNDAFSEAGRLPHLVLAAHVHDYQRFERRQTVGAVTRTVPYIVAGAGGYAGFDSLHRVLDGVLFPEGVTLVKSNAKLPGFLRLAVSAERLTAEYFVVPRPPDHISADHPATLFDTFDIKL